VAAGQPAVGGDTVAAESPDLAPRARGARLVGPARRVDRFMFGEMDHESARNRPALRVATGEAGRFSEPCRDTRCSRELGRGGMGVVLQRRVSTALNRLVAVEDPRRGGRWAHPGFVARLRQEALGPVAHQTIAAWCR